MDDLTQATQTAVIIPVRQAEPVVAAHRRRLDRAATWGVPAHVTVVFPFVPPAEVDDGLVDRLAAVVAGVPAFDCALSTAPGSATTPCGSRPTARRSSAT